MQNEAEKMAERLDKRIVGALPPNWKAGKKCPECGVEADRPKCMWDMGSSCPRHDPSNYEPSPYVEKPDQDCAEAAAMIRAQAAEIGRLRRALSECVNTLALVESPALVDPVYGEEVRMLGDRIGYGALMASASASWRVSAKSRGMPEGGEFVAGPCFGTVVSTLKIARAALEPKP